MQPRWFVVLTAAILLVAAGAVLPVGAADTGEDRADSDAPPTGEDPPQLGTPEGFNSTVFEVRLYENASARWTIRHRRPLATQNERDQFETFAAEFNSTETQTYTDFKTRTRALTEYAGNATDRDMAASEYRKDAYVQDSFRQPGILEMSFTWTNFSRPIDRGVVVDDVFAGGMYIGPGQELHVVRDDALLYETVSPDPDWMTEEGNVTASAEVRWFGERNFGDQRPKLVAVEPGTVGQNSSSPNETTAGAATGQIGPAPIALALLLLLAVGAAIAWYSGSLDGLVGGDGEGDTAVDSGDTVVSEEAAPAEPAVPEEELLSDEDRVIKLLDENGGRMKQVKIVDETEWSKSKVSMLLSDMEDEGLISKLRVGRENIISKAGEEPDAVGSPFDDE